MIKFVYITTKDRIEAKRIGKELLEKRLAACVNIFDNMQSMYWWEDKIEETKETVLIAKTDESLLDKLTETVKRLHSYSCPCILSIPIEKGNADYIKWLEKELNPD